MAVLVLYLITFLTSLTFVVLLIVKNKMIDTLYIVFSLLIVINTLGRLLVAISPTLEVAIWANKFMYIGAIFTILCLIFVIAKLCNIKIPNWLKYSMIIAGFIVLGFVFTIGYSPIYYKECNLVFDNGYNYLKKEYGPAHKLYTILMITYAAILLFYTIYSIIKRKTISTFIVSTMSILGFIIVITYIVEKIIGTPDILLSISLIVSCILISRVLEHINTFDITKNVTITLDRLDEYGYIVIDKKMRYKSSNTYIKKIFEEIEKEWKVDCIIPNNNSFLYNEIILWSLTIGTKDKTICYNDQYLDVSVKPIKYIFKKMSGYLIEFIDRTEEHKYTSMIERFNDNLQTEVEKKTADIQNVQDKFIRGVASIVESRDNSTGSHINRTSEIVKIFSNHILNNKLYNLSEDFLKMVIKAAPMHDLGKISIDDLILRKQGKYTPEEYEKMKKHSEEGAIIIEKILRGVETDEFVDIAKNIAFYHHEKWNGEGYPSKLKKEEIPIEARIMALADVFDALVSKRCYKPSFTFDESFKIISDSLGTHFDPILGAEFILCRKDLEKLYTE